MALCVDHQLQGASGDWTRFAAGAAASQGAQFRALAWTGDKPRTGLPAAARAARHALIAEAARNAGAGVALFAHTRDDVAEAALMRAEGTSLGRLRAWAPSPAWPQGRGVFVLRPLLEVARSELRELLRARGLGWIEDPAGAEAYPIATFTWLLAYKKQDAKKAEWMRKLVEYCVTSGQASSDSMGYIPLPAGVVEKIKTASASKGGGIA